MRVGWVRGAGKIGLTQVEKGTRGAWVEKRRLLFSAFESHGAEVVPLTPLTDTTAIHSPYGLVDTEAPVDLIVLEFAGLNMGWYGEDWERAREIISRHDGKVMFVCDDPDLPLPLDVFKDERWSRWMFAFNAVNIAEVREALDVPLSVGKVIDLPLVGQYAEDATCEPEYEHKQLVYIGRNGGRSKIFKSLLPSVGLAIAGREKEWEKYDVEVVPMPEQRDRAAFYRTYFGAYAVFDQLHDRTGWRTGRAYHAHAAGVPVWIPSRTAGIDWAITAANRFDIARTLEDVSDEHRAELWNNQLGSIGRLAEEQEHKIQEVIAWAKA